MKKLLLALALFLLPTSVWAQCNGVFQPNTLCGNLTGVAAPPAQFSASSGIIGPGTSITNDIATWANAFGTQLKDSGVSIVNGQVINPTVGSGPSGAFLASSTGAAYSWQVTGQPADQKVWDAYATGTTLSFRAVNDAGNSVNNWLQAIRGTGATLNGIKLLTGTTGIDVDTYGGGSTNGEAGFQITGADNTALTGKERYTAWIGNTSAGTQDGTFTATTFALGVSSVKNNWTATAVAGQTVGLNVIGRGGNNNALNSGDTGGITVNVGASFSNNLVQQFEGISGYFPGGSTTNSLAINAQIGSIRATGLDTGGDTGIGFYTQAQNGILGNAFSAGNLCASPKYGTCSKWANFLVYSYDDGTHTPYQAYYVDQLGHLTIAGFGALGTNQKTFRVGGSVTNNLEILNGAGNAVILSVYDTGELQLGVGSFTANGSVATAMSSLGPAAAHTTVQEWFTVLNSGGTTRYIPAF